MNLVIEQIYLKKPRIEIAEHKGEGHPDTLCDTLCEKASNALSRYYLKHFGAVLHHNIDKGLIVAGTSKPKFKGGKIKDPVKIIIAGRATSKAGNIKIPAKKIIKKAIESYMKRFPLLKYNISVEIKEGASNLKEVFKRPIQIANDTSFGVSHYPLSRVEQIVLDIGKYLNSSTFRRKFPCIGKDIKVLGVRENNRVSITVAAAFISKHVKDMNHYKTLKERVVKHLLQKFKVSKIFLNTLDSYNDESSIYLTVSGLSCEQGDDGQVGRSNRHNGVISANIPMSLEATAGKNVSHPGKLYQILAYQLAKRVVNETSAKKAIVRIITQIGKPLDEPYVVHVQATGKINLPKIQEIAKKTFKDIPKIQLDIIRKG